MNPRMFLSMAAATMSLVFAVGCSSDAKKKEAAKKEKTAQTRTEIMNAHYTSLSFDRGESSLSDRDKINLQDLAKKIRDSGRDVDDIKILTWADKEYGEGKGASNTEIILARQRAESIKRYMEEELMTDEDVDFYNMAQKPGPLSRFFKTNETKVQETFKANNDVNMLDDSHASKALVIIEYEDGMKSNI